MKIQADTRQRASALSNELPWHPSPDGSVCRRMLDRDGGEVARATSLVKYPAGSRFPSHSHERGEEFLVLEGIFSDEFGDYPPGTYVRNPPGSAHAPFSRDGCVIFVKLRQFDPQDLARVVIATERSDFCAGRCPGLLELELHRFGDEHVRLFRAISGVNMGAVSWPGGAEYLVLKGELADAEDRYPAGAWLRLPPGARQVLKVMPGAEFYLKTGHLAALNDQQGSASI